MMTDWTTTQADDRAAVKKWFDDWGAMVAAQRFEDARPLFHKDAIGFGTWMDLVEGLDQLEAKQWRSIWGTIQDFHHETDRTLKVLVSPDRLTATGLLTWTSTGFDEAGAPYERPGRTTALFVRGAVGDPWLAIHTHVSLFRGVPQKSFGPPQA
jgi:ketosteroid isomerase-like protein